MGLMILGMALFWGLLILLSVWFAKVLFNPETKQPRSKSKDRQHPRTVLAERFLRGEISEEQYRRIEDDLK